MNASLMMMDMVLSVGAPRNHRASGQVGGAVEARQQPLVEQCGVVAHQFDPSATACQRRSGSGWRSAKVSKSEASSWSAWGVSTVAAQKLVKQLDSVGIVRTATGKHRKSALCQADDILDLMEQRIHLQWT